MLGDPDRSEGSLSSGPLMYLDHVGRLPFL